MDAAAQALQGISIGVNPRSSAAPLKHGRYFHSRPLDFQYANTR